MTTEKRMKFGFSIPPFGPLADPDMLEELEKIDNRAVALLAVFFGKTRLIDNEVITVP